MSYTSLLCYHLKKPQHFLAAFCTKPCNIVSLSLEQPLQARGWEQPHTSRRGSRECEGRWETVNPQNPHPQGTPCREQAGVSAFVHLSVYMLIRFTGLYVHLWLLIEKRRGADF